MPENNTGFANESELLKKIDLIRERTGVSYRQAQEALERNKGDLLKTLIDLEEKDTRGENNDANRTNWTEEFSLRSTEVINKVKDIIRQGNVNKIRIKHDGKVLADIPISLGAIGAVVLPQLAALGVILAMFNKCTIEVVHNTDEEETNLKNDTDEKTKINNDPF